MNIKEGQSNGISKLFLSTIFLKQNDSKRRSQEEEKGECLQTLEESEEGGGGGGDVGRPTTGQTNTSWFLFSMAT